MIGCSLLPVFSQETADSYFSRISDYYGTVKDYEADLIITRGSEIQKAHISYKSPNLLRLDFSDPDGQVLCTDGKELELFIPRLGVSFTQELKYHDESTLAAMASNQGLTLLMRNYGIAYLEGPSYVPLDPGSNEKVIKLKLDWRSANEGFRKIEIAVGQNNLIRRIIGYSTTGTVLQFDFLNIVINRNIPMTRFDYEVPPVGNSIVNFLFDPEDN